MLHPSKWAVFSLGERVDVKPCDSTSLCFVHVITDKNYIGLKTELVNMQTLLKEIVNVSISNLSSQAVSELPTLSPLTSQPLPRSVYFQELLVFFEDDIEEAANLGHVDV